MVASSAPFCFPLLSFTVLISPALGFAAYSQ